MCCMYVRMYGVWMGSRSVCTWCVSVWCEAPCQQHTYATYIHVYIRTYICTYRILYKNCHPKCLETFCHFMVIRIRMNKMAEGDKHLDIPTNIRADGESWSAFARRVS